MKNKVLFIIGLLSGMQLSAASGQFRIIEPITFNCDMCSHDGKCKRDHDTEVADWLQKHVWCKSGEDVWLRTGNVNMHRLDCDSMSQQDLDVIEQFDKTLLKVIALDRYRVIRAFCMYYSSYGPLSSAFIKEQIEVIKKINLFRTVPGEVMTKHNDVLRCFEFACADNQTVMELASKENAHKIQAFLLGKEIPGEKLPLRPLPPIPPSFCKK